MKFLSQMRIMKAISIALLLGYILGGRTANRMFALWVWAVPALWMLFAVLVWNPTTGVGESVWGYFFGGAWWGLPASPVRGKWVADQFTHTVPLYTSIAYALGAVLRRPRHSEQVSTPDAVPVVK